MKTSLVRAAVAAALVIGGTGLALSQTSSAPVAASASAPATRAATRPSEIPGVKNFARVAEGLYRGEQPTKEGFAELKKRGIKTIVNLRDFHSDRDLMAGTGLTYIHIKCDAWAPDDDKVVDFLKVISDKNNHPVFVHCAHGADRTGMMVAAYRVVEEGWTPAEAIAELPNFGFHTVWQSIKTYLAKVDAADMRKKVTAHAVIPTEIIK